MRHIYLFLAALILTACSKEDIGPMGLKHGQEVEVFIDHRYGAINDRPLLLPNRQPSEYSLHGFDEREPGYIYKVKAKVHIDSNDPPIQDAAPYWLDFSEVISEEKYTGNESFELELIQSYIPGGPVIVLMKDEEKYFFHSNIQLTYNDAEIGNQLDDIWQNREEIRQDHQAKIPAEPKWRSIRAAVSHDLDNFGKAYKVSHIEFKD